MTVVNVRAVALLCFLIVAPLPSGAQEAYPNRPVRMIVSYPPGGVVDLVARTLGAMMQESLGQSLVIDNRPGGATIIATEITSRTRVARWRSMMCYRARLKASSWRCPPPFRM